MNIEQPKNFTRRSLFQRAAVVGAGLVVGGSIIESTTLSFAEQIPESPVEVIDYDNAKLLGQVPGNRVSSVVHGGTGAFGMSTHADTDSYQVHLGTTMPEGENDKLEIHRTDNFDTPAILRMGLNDQIIYAGFVTNDNKIVVRSYAKDLSSFTDVILGEGVNDGRFQWPLTGFAMLPFKGRQMAVVANHTIESINPERGNQPKASLGLIIADLETGEKFDIRADSSIKRPGETVFMGDEYIAQITKDGDDFLTITALGLWRTSFNSSSDTWETTFEPFEIPYVGRPEMSYPCSVSYDHETGQIFYTTSSSDVYFGVLRRNADGSGWTSEKNQLVLERTDQEPWNGNVGNSQYAYLPFARPAGTEDVIFMTSAVWFGQPFDSNRLFGIEQEPVIHRNGTFERSNPIRKRGEWELLANVYGDHALVVTSDLSEPVLSVKKLPYDTSSFQPIPTFPDLEPDQKQVFLPSLSR
ncbi:MAG: hypothetical protein WBO77_04390 [Microgenomates group bacterium]